MSVHPHVRGEHGRLPHSLSRDRAVHPHVRGEHLRGGVFDVPTDRFIPTCVGSTLLPYGISNVLGLAKC